jgi:hypothetical protein
MTDAEQLLAKIRDQNKKRQQEFYKRNKDAINEKRRLLYKAGRNALQGTTHEEPLLVEQSQEPVVVEEDETFEIELPPKKTKTNSKNSSPITYDDALLKLKEMNLATATYNKYKDDLKRFVSITGCQDISKCLKKSNQIIKEINNSKKKNGETYSNNTIKGIYQSILFIIDNLKLDVNKDPYLHEFEIRKIQSTDDNKDRIENEVVLPFKEYLTKVKDTFGENSKMYLIASLYDELTVRDDFQLKLISNQKDASDDKINYLVIPRTGNYRIIINTYKTEQKYGVIDHACSKRITGMIKKYIDGNGIKNGDYLFGNKALTQFVSFNNPKIAIQGGINYFRHMKITDELKSIKSPEERKALADKMRHSPNTQLAYLRKQKLI